ncbi:MAG TPA: acetyl-CoA carboxylase, carboxyltransferase subunit beta [Chloroflexia bacterium]|nr:acetyl-CoA carboxylase, carboxyltransferase subunit beta [Chloroflexia bacterium]
MKLASENTTTFNHKGKDHHFFQRKTISSKPVMQRHGSNHAPGIWVKCPSCHELAYTKEHFRNHKVCQKCKYHFRLNWRERLATILDEGSWVEVNAGIKTSDPLHFSNEGESYPEKISRTRARTGLNEALITGYGTVEGLPLAVAVVDFAFLGASMGSVFGEKLVRLIELCIEQRMPLLTVSASGGARMHEGLLSLMQMAKTTAALGLLSKARLPHISLLTDPCYGGVTASYSMVADMILAEPGAMIGFAGPRVIEQTTRQKLPAGFQTAEFLLEHGMIDQVVERKELRTTLSSLLRLYRRSTLTANNQPVLFSMKIGNHSQVEELRNAS